MQRGSLAPATEPTERHARQNWSHIPSGVWLFYVGTAAVLFDEVEKPLRDDVRVDGYPVR